MSRIALLLSLGLVVTGFLHAQPNITSLQSGFSAYSGPINGAAITSGSGLNTFVLFINGTFDPANVHHVEWTNTDTGVVADFTPSSGLTSVSATQIQVTVPSTFAQHSLYATAVAAPQNVTIVVFEQLSQLTGSNPGIFTVNPPLTAVTSMPAGTAGQPYSAPFFTGGTGPFENDYASVPNPGMLPPGLGFTSTPNIVGTPTQTGIFSFQASAYDAWGNYLVAPQTIEIVPTASVSSLTPNSAFAGSNAVTINVIGKNFVQPTTGLPVDYPGTVIVLIASGPSSTTIIPLATTVNNSTSATATIPANYLVAPIQYEVAAEQPSQVLSNTDQTFTVIGPSISQVSPSSVTARSAAVNLTVTGGAFLALGSAAPNPSTILVNGSPVATTFGSQSSLSAPVVFSTPGSFPIRVENPAGSLSNIVNVNVLPTPVILSVTPSPFPGGTLTVTGSNFSSTMTVLFNGTAIATTFVNNGQLNGTVPSTLYVGSTAQVAVQTADNYVTPPFTISLTGTLVITTSSVPSGVVLQGYDAKLNATGGTQPYSWSASGLPQGFSINPSTGEITGTPTSSGFTQFTVTVTDALQKHANATFFLTISPSITSVSPASVVVRSTPVSFTVTGAGFVGIVGSAPSSGQSVILVNGNAVSTTFNGSTSLSGSAVFSAVGNVPVQVFNPDETTSNIVNISVIAAPTLTSATPNPFLGGKLTATGTGFTSTMTVLFNGSPLATTFVNATQLTATVPASLYTGTTANVSVQTADNYATNTVRITLATPPQITTANIPQANGLQPYDVKLAATGGTPPYLWSATGLPQGLSINPSTGEISGTPSSSGTFNLSVTVTDSYGLSSTAHYQGVISSPASPPQLNPATLPNGFVNVSYNFTFSATGGTGTLNFGLASGSVPPGLNLDTTGVLKGLPTTAGTYTFSVSVSDNLQLSSSASFTLIIKPQPLSITTPGPLATVTVGAAVNMKFAAFGGVPPYTFSSSGNLPPGTSIASDGTFSGTTTTPGAYSFTVIVNDSAQDPQGTKTFSMTVSPAPLTVTASLGNGQVAAAYSGTIGATGGVPPYTFAVTGLPDGVSFNTGKVSGTPTTAGSYTVNVTVTDSTKATATSSFPVTINPAALTVTTASLPDGTVNVAYTASLAASGGTGKYSWSVSGLPAGLSATAAGSISGTPTAPGTFPVTATVTDTGIATAVVSASKTFTVTIAAAPLTLTTASLAGAVAGTAYSASVAASGGVPPYTFTASGLPAGLTIASGGAISGTTTAVGNATVSITVKDSAGTSASKTLTIAVALPPTPSITVSGLPATSSPATQSTVTVGIGSAFPVAVTVNLTLTFTPDSGGDDPTVQFATGGRAATVNIPAGSTTASATVGVQTGTVAGTVTVTIHLLAGTTDITPTPAPTRTVRINSVAPVITSVTATASSGGFTVTIVGFATSRSMTQAVFNFTAASGVSLQTTSVTVPASALFSGWYSSNAATPFGGQFSYTQPFNVSGATSAVSSVSVTLSNGDGTSAAGTSAVH